MNRNNKHIDAHCGFDGDLIGFIYNEIEPTERQRVTQHIAVCAACEQEIGALTGARSAVAAWRRDTFDQMPSPVIPRFDAVETPGLFVAAAEWFRALGRTGLATAALGVVAIIAAIVMFAGRPSVVPLDTVASDSGSSAKEIPPVSVAESTIAASKPAPEADAVSDVRVQDRTAGSRSLQRYAARTPATVRRRPISRRDDRKPSGDYLSTEAPSVRLSDFSESEDESLRLAELVSQVRSDR